MGNNWKEIWNRRRPVEGGLDGDWQEVFLELKRLNGYDVIEGGIPLDSYLNFNAGLVELLDLTPGKSVYEVGCGAGANMYLMQREGMIVGGSDYAEGLVETARMVVPDAREMGAMEAADIPTEEKYDAVYSCGVFSYFPDESYAETVLEKMLEKTCGSIVLLDVHDAEKRADFLSARRMIDPDYDERYKNLDKFFYRRSFFDEFAQKHDLSIAFADSTIKGYWNNPFIYHVYFHRKEESER